MLDEISIIKGPDAAAGFDIVLCVDEKVIFIECKCSLTSDNPTYKISDQRKDFKSKFTTLLNKYGKMKDDKIENATFTFGNKEFTLDNFYFLLTTNRYDDNNKLLSIPLEIEYNSKIFKYTLKSNKFWVLTLNELKNSIGKSFIPIFDFFDYDN